MCSIFNTCVTTGQNIDSFDENNYHKEVTPFIKNKFLKCVDIPKPNKVHLSEIVEKSSIFPIRFPINTCRVQSQSQERHKEIEYQINSVRPVLHERALWLYLNFLEYKSIYGDDEEKNLYENMGICELIQRLLEKRCVTFWKPTDSYRLLNGKCGMELYAEKNPLDLCLTYDEIKLSALLSVSSKTEFINDGSRLNRGRIEKNKSKIERDGIIIGLIGARFERAAVMEYQDIVIDEFQNRKQNGYGYNLKGKSESNLKIPQIFKKQFEYRQLWNTFYNENDFEYTEAVKIFVNNNNNGQRLIGSSLHPAEIFDSLVMKKRLAISIDTLLLEAEFHAFSSSKQAYIHVVGIGLGVWKFCTKQDYLFMEIFGNRIDILKNKLNHIGYINFSWFQSNECNGIKNDELYKIKNHPNGGIKLFFSKRNPHEKLNTENFPNCLLVVSYAWDGNALPGNEFWDGAISASGDPAAACSTLISELHNPHINSKMCNGNNLHVATYDYGVIHIAEYVKRKLHFN